MWMLVYNLPRGFAARVAETKSAALEGLSSKVNIVSAEPCLYEVGDEVTKLNQEAVAELATYLKTSCQPTVDLLERLREKQASEPSEATQANEASRRTDGACNACGWAPCQCQRYEY